jgi:hypothetical protein
MPEATVACRVCRGDLAQFAPAARSACAPECDTCRAGGPHEVIERFCRATESRDPVEIALALLRHSSMRLHGPEHRFLVAAALLAAYANVRGEAKAKAGWLAEARRAVEAAPSQACACDLRTDASVGHAAGLFVATAKGDGTLAKKLAAASVALASQVKGASCCKRSSFLSLLQACHFTREHLGTDLRAQGPACEWWRENKQCIRDACPFYRPAAA